jgi:hypothetical protein
MLNDSLNIEEHPLPRPLVALRPDSELWPSLTGLRDHTHWTHHTRYDSPTRVISPMHKPLPDKTQHPEEKNLHVSVGIRTRNPSKRAAADPLLR